MPASHLWCVLSICNLMHNVFLNLPIIVRMYYFIETIWTSNDHFYSLSCFRLDNKNLSQTKGHQTSFMITINMYLLVSPFTLLNKPWITLKKKIQMRHRVLISPNTLLPSNELNRCILYITSNWNPISPQSSSHTPFLIFSQLNPPKHIYFFICKHKHTYAH